MASDLEWDELVGWQVQVQWEGRTVRTGCVEAVTASADALWIAAQGVDSRALYEKAQGYRVLPLRDEARKQPSRQK